MTGEERSIGPLALALGLLWGLLMAGTPALGQPAALKCPVPTPAPAKPPQPVAQKQEYPLHISAAQMEADQDQRLITFKGQVKADYADYTLYSDKLLIFYKPQEKGKSPPPAAEKGQETNPLGGLGGEQIDRIEAWGNVRCVQEDRVATGEKAIFYKDKDQIVLLGHPQVWRGEDHLKGTKIILYLATKKAEVESSPEQRVEAHLYQATKGGQTPSELFSPGGSKAVPRTGRRK